MGRERGIRATPFVFRAGWMAVVWRCACHLGVRVSSRSVQARGSLGGPHLGVNRERETCLARHQDDTCAGSPISRARQWIRIGSSPASGRARPRSETTSRRVPDRGSPAQDPGQHRNDSMSSGAVPVPSGSGAEPLQKCLNHETFPLNVLYCSRDVHDDSRRETASRELPSERHRQRRQAFIVVCVGNDIDADGAIADSRSRS